MSFEEVKQYIEENKNSEELKVYLQGFTTVEGVQKFLIDNEDGRRFFDSEKNKHLTKGLDTWKANNLQKEIDKKISALYPDESAEQKQFRELNAKIEKIRSCPKLRGTLKIIG